MDDSTYKRKFFWPLLDALPAPMGHYWPPTLTMEPFSRRRWWWRQFGLKIVTTGFNKVAQSGHTTHFNCRTKFKVLSRAAAWVKLSFKCRLRSSCLKCLKLNAILNNSLLYEKPHSSRNLFTNLAYLGECLQ